MKLSVATNFDDELIERVRDYPVAELFGKLPRDFVGGGRPSYLLAPLSRRRLAQHVRLARASGIEFNYLLNAACLDNREFTRRGQREFDRVLGWLGDIGVTTITVSLPYLLELIKERFPQFRVTVGVFARVATVQQVKFWEELGADCITLDPLVVNRDFRTLASVRASVRCDLQLIANSDCLLFCPLASYHMVGLSHASQRGHPSPGVPLDYCFLACTAAKLADPVHYIRSNWIRPEDLELYERAGYTRFKILERGAPTDVMVTRVGAYADRRYDGNLLALIDPLAGRQPAELQRGVARALMARWRDAWRLLLLRRGAVADLSHLAELRLQFADPARPAVYLDNRKLDGFLETFPAAACAPRDCRLCRYCDAWAARAVTIDPDHRARYAAAEQCLRQSLINGSLWRRPTRRGGERGAGPPARPAGNGQNSRNATPPSGAAS